MGPRFWIYRALACPEFYRRYNDGYIEVSDPSHNEMRAGGNHFAVILLNVLKLRPVNVLVGDERQHDIPDDQGVVEVLPVGRMINAMDRIGHDGDDTTDVPDVILMLDATTYRPRRVEGKQGKDPIPDTVQRVLKAFAAKIPQGPPFAVI